MKTPYIQERSETLQFGVLNQKQAGDHLLFAVPRDLKKLLSVRCDLVLRKDLPNGPCGLESEVIFGTLSLFRRDLLRAASRRCIMVPSNTSPRHLRQLREMRI